MDRFLPNKPTVRQTADSGVSGKGRNYDADHLKFGVLCTLW